MKDFNVKKNEKKLMYGVRCLVKRDKELNILIWVSWTDRFKKLTRKTNDFNINREFNNYVNYLMNQKGMREEMQ